MYLSTRFPDRRPSARIRRPAAALCGLLLAGAGLSACDAGTAGSGTAGGQGGLTFATDTEPSCIDPAVSPLDVTALIDRNIFDSLVNASPDGKIHPWLAKSWTVSKDARTYTFELRKGVTFHDGTPLDAAAVKASLDHVVDPATKSSYAAGLLSAYREAKTEGLSTVRIVLKRPDATLLQSLSTAYLGIQSPKALKNTATLCRTPVGTGPFRFVGWKQKQSIELRNNGAYKWGPPTAAHTGPAKLPGLTIRFIQENAVRVGALSSGEVDVIGGLPAPNVKALKRSPRLQVLSSQAPGGTYSVHLNPARGPLKDKRVRTAFVRSVELDQLVKSVSFGQYERAWSQLGPRTLGYDEQIEGSWAPDRRLANRLLDEAGWSERDSEGYRVKNGKRLTLHWPFVPQLLREQRDVLGQGIQTEAKKVGIQVRREAKDTGTYSKEIFAGDADLWDSSNVRADPDVLRTLYASDQTLTQGGMNVFKISDPEIDTLLRHGAATADPAARADDYVKVQRRLRDEALVLPVYVPTYLIGASKDVQGLSFEAASYPLFYDVSLGDS
ncbi:ABC transporter substrate-binding protein [Streptomyces sp. NPDC052052]|uniref:ABC transporter substrate-binding protein n=1 Tax=Streptomyces sp. NPDC052052 TaxID=3154756 RepID=UPI003444D6CD